jgi:NADH dehydrogenase
VRRRYYPSIPDEEMSFYLVEMKDAVLPEMTPEMGQYARRRLERRGYQVRLGTPLREVREDAAVIGDGEVIPTRTVVWTGGVRPSPLVADSGIEVDRAGRAVAVATMETSRPGVFAIGDCASIANPDDPEGRPYVPNAQNAVREAKTLARNVIARIDGGPMHPFRYRMIGSLASIGSATGVGVVYGIQVRGFIAWVMWRGYYWLQVPRVNRKVRVLLDWGLTALFGIDPVQLKVEEAQSALGSSGRRRPRPRFVDPRS